MSNNAASELYDLEFIGTINGLNESIKEYYKVSKHNIKEANTFLNFFEKEWKALDNLINETPNNNIPNQSELISQEMNKLESITNQLKKNSDSNETNLNLFFEDAKVLFKKLKLRRNENLKNFRRSISSKKKDNINNINNERRINNRFDDFHSNNNLSKSQILKTENTKKIIYYLNQLKDYNEIIGKFSVKAKFNFINLQKMIFSIIKEEKGEDYDELLNVQENSYFKYRLNFAELSPNINRRNNFQTTNKYEKQISELNDKIKDLEKIINDNKVYYMQGKQLNELKKKLELELINGNSDKYSSINYTGQNDFEDMVLNIIETNKNSLSEINNLKNDINKKNEMIKNLNLKNNQYKNDLLDKDNALQDKENEILTLEQDIQRYKSKYEELNITIKNLNHKINAQKDENFNYKNKIFELENTNIFNSYENSFNNRKISSINKLNDDNQIYDLKKEIQNLSKENNSLKNELNNLKLNMYEAKKKKYIKINNNDNDNDMLGSKNNKYIFNKKKYEQEINALSKKSQDLSKKLTLKNKEIINLQRENLNLKSELEESNYNLNIQNIKSHSQIADENNKNNKADLLENQNIKLKNIINNIEKEKNNLKSNLYKYAKENKALNKKLELQAKQLQALSNSSNYNENIISLQQELEELRNMTKEKYKGVEYEQQINNLQNILNEKDELINQYKEKIKNMKNNNMPTVNNMIKSNEANNEINQLRLLNDDLRNDLENKNKEIEFLRNPNNKNQNNLIDQYKNEINELSKLILKSNSIIENKDLMIKKLKENKGITNNSNENMELKIIELENQINELKKENQALTQEIMEYNNNNNQMNNNLSDINLLNLKINKLEEEKEYYKNKTEELQGQITKVFKEGFIDKNGGNENALFMNNNKIKEELEFTKKENLNFQTKINNLNKEVENLKMLNDKLQKDYIVEKNQNSELIKENSAINEKNKSLMENSTNVIPGGNEDFENKLKKKEEELEGFKTFVFKLQKELEKANDSIDGYKNKINALQKENSSMKKQLERLSESIPKELNALQVQLGEAYKKNNQLGLNNTQQKNMTDREKKKSNNKNNTDVNQENYNNLLSKYNDASKEISELKNKNKELQFQLEEKEVKSAYSGYRTEDVNISNYEEEFDLRKMANGAKDKNRSEDINIDYPGIQGIKDKLKEMEFKFKNLVDQVKILIGNIPFSQKIKPQVTQICQLIGYSPKTTGRILTSTKDKKKILGI